jgi:hypothetical protein
MTATVLFLAFNMRTPAFLWATAMVCDTILLTVYMMTKS